jgi:integrase
MQPGVAAKFRERKTMPVENRGTDKSPRWRYAFTIRGVRYRAAIPEARTKFEALQAELEAKKAVFEGRYGRPSGEHGFEQFVKTVYLPWAREHKRTWKHDEFRARTLCEHKSFRGKTFAQISPLAIEKFKSDRRKSTITFKEKPDRPRSPASVNRELELLSRIFTLAIREKVTDFNPCSQVQKMVLDNRRLRYLLDEEEPRLLAQLVGTLAHLRPLVIVAISTGMRRGDQLNLLWEKVDFQRNVIYVPNSKTGRDYPLPMNEDVRTVMLQLRREARGSGHVFINQETNNPYRDLKKGFLRACDLAGIKNLHWHDLRHTFGTRLAEAGYSEAVIAEMMGHTDPKTTRRYTHATERGKLAAVESIRRSAENSRPIYAPNEKQRPILTAVNS